MIDIIKSIPAPESPIVFLTTAQLIELIRQQITEALNHVPNGDRLLDADEAAKLLSVSPDWLYRQAKHLPFSRRLGPKMLRFSHDGIVRWLATRRAIND